MPLMADSSDLMPREKRLGHYLYNTQLFFNFVVTYLRLAMHVLLILEIRQA